MEPRSLADRVRAENEYPGGLVDRFMAVFRGRGDSHWTGAGELVHSPATPGDFQRHLAGLGPGLAIAPLLPHDTCQVAAADLDRPSLRAARELQRRLPGPSFVERSGGGNLHVWVFFPEPVEAFVASGVLASAALAAAVPAEVCPALDQWRATSHIKLPYHGSSRPMLDESGERIELTAFLDLCERTRSDPDAWRGSAQRRGLSRPDPLRRSPIARLAAAARRVAGGLARRAGGRDSPPPPA